MTIEERRMCDIFPQSKAMMRVKVSVEYLTNYEGDNDDLPTPVEAELNVCQQAGSRILRFIDRGITRPTTFEAPDESGLDFSELNKEMAIVNKHCDLTRRDHFAKATLATMQVYEYSKTMDIALPANRRLLAHWCYDMADAMEDAR